MAIPKYNEFFPYVLLALKDGELHPFREIVDFCADSFHLSEEEKALTMDSGKAYLPDRVGWARTYLKKAGLIENPVRGKLGLTKEGMRVVNLEPMSVTLEYLMRYPDFASFLGRNYKQSANETTTSDSQKEISPQEQISNAVLAMNNALADELMDEVMKMTPFDFEKLIIKLLVAMGYGSMIDNQSSVTKKTGDEGIDGVLKADKFGFDSIYIQAKQWKADSTVGRPDIQKFGGAMMGQGANKGLFITTAKFSDAAWDYARKNLSSKIVLVDGESLAKLMIEYNIGVSTVETVHIKKVDTDFFVDFD